MIWNESMECMDHAQLFSRTTIVNKEKEITGDSLYHDDRKGISEGFGNRGDAESQGAYRLYLYCVEERG